MTVGKFGTEGGSIVNDPPAAAVIICGNEETLAHRGV